MARINQHHIARHLNISQVTVSRALRGGPVAEETRRRIFAACEELGYHIHYTAQSLASGRTNNLLYAIEGFQNLTGQITHAQLVGAGETAMAQGYKISIDVVEHVPELAASGFMDGALVALHTPALYPDFMEWARKTDFPVVLVDGPVDEPGIANVRVDDWKAAYDLTSYLLSLGHRDLLYFGLVESSAICCTRLAGFMAAVARIPGAKGRFITTHDWVNRPEEVLEQLADGLPDHLPTAIVGASDAAATGILALLAEMGIRVPERVSVAGFGNARWTSCLTPPLTTVDLQGRQVGQTAMETLLRLVNGGRRRMVRKVPPRLIVRKSTAERGIG